MGHRSGRSGLRCANPCQTSLRAEFNTGYYVNGTNLSTRRINWILRFMEQHRQIGSYNKTTTIYDALSRMSSNRPFIKTVRQDELYRILNQIDINTTTSYTSLKYGSTPLQLYNCDCALAHQKGLRINLLSQ